MASTPSPGISLGTVHDPKLRCGCKCIAGWDLMVLPGFFILPFTLNQFLMPLNNNSALVSPGEELSSWCLFYTELAHAGPGIGWSILLLGRKPKFPHPLLRQKRAACSAQNSSREIFLMLSKISSKWALAVSSAPPAPDTLEIRSGWRRMVGIKVPQECHLSTCFDAQRSQWKITSHFLLWMLLFCSFFQNSDWGGFNLKVSGQRMFCWSWVPGWSLDVGFALCMHWVTI